MDLKIYYAKIRELAASMDPFVVVASLETSDGGKPGTMTEMPRDLAAKALIDGRARLATPEEAQGFRDQQATARILAQEEAAAKKIHFTLMSATGATRATTPTLSAKE